MAPTSNYPFMTCLVKVKIGCSTVTKILSKCHGVYKFRMDGDGVVEISGTVDPDQLLKMLGNNRSKAKLILFQFGECSSNLFVPYSGQDRISNHIYSHRRSYADYDHNHSRGDNQYRYNYGQRQQHGDSWPHDRVYDHNHSHGDYQYRYDYGQRQQHGGCWPHDRSTDIDCCRVM